MQKLKINGIYKHYKGDYYLVLGTCKNSETLEELVLYKALYGDGQTWVRNINTFLEELDEDRQKTAKQKYRYQYTKVESVRKKTN